MLSDRQKEWEQRFVGKVESKAIRGDCNGLTHDEELQLRALYLLAIIADQLNALIRDNGY